MTVSSRKDDCKDQISAAPPRNEVRMVEIQFTLIKPSKVNLLKKLAVKSDVMQLLMFTILIVCNSGRMIKEMFSEAVKYIIVGYYDE